MAMAMAIVTGDAYVEWLLKFLEEGAEEAAAVLEGSRALKLNPVGLHYVHNRLQTLKELEALRAGAPVDYLRAYIADLGDFRALEQLRRVLALVPRLRIVSLLPHRLRDPTPVCVTPFARLHFLELRSCNLSAAPARGLLQLRCTLERLVCYNSTDALRHIFAERIVDIKSCPLWTRLTFVSCSSNNMQLMDESLELLPSVEYLDLSQNRFAKISNLHKCTKLKHLNLGYNHIRTISSIQKVSPCVKTLILKNNAIASLHGIECLPTLEGLDLSFNLISNFSEIELLASLPSLERLWLEGNPISYAKHYRQEIFSCASDPQKLILDEKRITRKEAFTIRFMLSRRQKHRSGYGFYAPANYEVCSDVTGEVGTSTNIQPKRKRRLSLVASIDNPEVNGQLLNGIEEDERSPSFITESQPKSQKETNKFKSLNAVHLFDKVDHLKKENAEAWYQHLNDLFYFNDVIDNNTSNLRREKQVKMADDNNNEEHESKGLSNVYSDSSVLNQTFWHSGNHVGECNSSFTLGENLFDSLPKEISYGAEKLKYENNLNMKTPDASTVTPKGVNGNTKEVVSMDEAIRHNGVCIISESNYSPGSSSPPHYEEDILHRRQNLQDEFMQLSLDSVSFNSASDSETSDDDSCFSVSSSSENMNAMLCTRTGNEDADTESRVPCGSSLPKP